ncbi:hypothetical protein [Aliikangiella coralliicola]|uniref:Uncharacterized protein n=1 Tax=Aliikangiella coralliicola TaxID=2592383 RepID=A0A545U6H0_9GAMM|nr:hypothetical protein [Aliikangiella coralliicola]TQV85069.1 hypothetical protein FLL46_22025 [Aliikangiella coralliicola]
MRFTFLIKLSVIAVLTVGSYAVSANTLNKHGSDWKLAKQAMAETNSASFCSIYLCESILPYYDTPRARRDKDPVDGMVEVTYWHYIGGPGPLPQDPRPTDGTDAS